MFVFDILRATFILFIEMSPYLILGLLFVGLLNIFISKDLIAKHIGDSSFISVLKAALFGIPLPLCSCGVIPASVYMAKNGASKPAVVAFLIATPQTGIDSIMATYGMLGPVFAVFRPIAALLAGIVGGLLTHTFVFDKGETKSDFKISLDSYSLDAHKKRDFRYYLKKMLVYPFVEFLDDIAVQFIIGLFIAGLISYFVPDDFFGNSIISNGLPGMLALLLMAIPMYVCATASIPIALSLILKGFSPGVAFVFLAAGPATNAASLSVISKVLGKRTAALYVSVISLTAILSGLLLDWIFAITDINIFEQIANSGIHHIGIFSIFQWSLSVILFILLSMSIYRKFIKSKFRKDETMQTDKRKIFIDGMTCNHCVANVKNAIQNTAGVESVEIILSENLALVTGDFSFDELKNNVEKIGYKVNNE